MPWNAAFSLSLSVTKDRRKALFGFFNTWFCLQKVLCFFCVALVTLLTCHRLCIDYSFICLYITKSCIFISTSISWVISLLIVDELIYKEILTRNLFKCRRKVTVDCSVWRREVHVAVGLFRGSFGALGMGFCIASSANIIGVSMTLLV